MAQTSEASRKNRLYMKAMEWPRLICAQRLGLEKYGDNAEHLRSDFQRDYDRMIFSSPFRRLQNKTQVFPLPGSIFVHNRLTHSLEVSSVGRSMAGEVAMKLRERHAAQPWVGALNHIGDIVATACLCHDLGNPPFGHSGEKTIATYFTENRGASLRGGLSPQQWADLTNFEGNANSFRLLTHQFCGRREGGYAMTYSTLASIVKYPYSSLHAGQAGKFGFFASEEEVYRRVAAELGIPEIENGRFARHPLCYLMEAADDICYQIMDIEDAHKLKILATDEVKHLLLGYFDAEKQQHLRTTMSRLSDPNEQVGYLRSKVIGALVAECSRIFVDNEQAILRGEFQGSLIDHATPLLADGYRACSDTAWAKIYCAPYVVDIEIAGNRIITYLLDTLTEAVLHPERNFSQLMLAKIPQQYDFRSPTLYGKLQSVLDHISGMTDVYALDLYRRLNGHTLPAV